MDIQENIASTIQMGRTSKGKIGQRMETPKLKVEVMETTKIIRLNATYVENLGTRHQIVGLTPENQRNSRKMTVKHRCFVDLYTKRVE